MNFPKHFLAGVALLGVAGVSLAGAEAAKATPSTPARIMPAKSPVTADWVANEGARLGKDPSVTAEDIRFSARAKLLASGAKATEGDIEALARRLLVQASAQSKADLKAMMAAAQKTNEEKKAQREAAEKTMQPNKPASQVGQLRDPNEILLQQAKDRQARLDRMIAEAPKK